MKSKRVRAVSSSKADMSSLQKLEDYISNYESNQFSLSRSRLPKPSLAKRATLSTSKRQAPPPLPARAKSPAKEYREEAHVLQRLEYFTATLKQRALVRAHELRQLRLMLMADLDWDCEVSADLKLSSILPHPSDLRDDEYQALAMGDSMLGMPKASPPPPPQRGRASADESSLNGPSFASMEWEDADYQRMQGEKLHRLKLLLHNFGKPPASSSSLPEQVATSVPRPSSATKGRRRNENLPSEPLPPKPTVPATFAHLSRSDDSAAHIVEDREIAFGIGEVAREPDLLQSSVQSLHSYRAHSRAAASADSALQFVRIRSEQVSDGDEPALDLFSLAREKVHIAGANVSASSTPSRQPRTPQFNPLFS